MAMAPLAIPINEQGMDEVERAQLIGAALSRGVCGSEELQDLA